jgi:H+/Cl- antiporter ClcA/CBS domain-containing protein
LNDTDVLAIRAGAVALQPTPGYRLGFVSLAAAVIGFTAGLIAFLLYNLIGLFTNLAFYHEWSFHFRSPEGNHLGPWVIVMPVVGGLIVGVMAKYGSDKIKGHGIPEAMEAVLKSSSRIEAKVAILKPLSAAIAIGTGGPFGAEGPIIQTGGAVGSLVGQLLSTTAVERKVLLACGAGAGMAATFNTPIAGVILAIELLLFEFRARSFIPLVIATTLATSVHLMLLGRGAMFHMLPTDFSIPGGLPYYLLLGVVCGFAAVGFTKLLYLVEDQFDRLPVDEFWHPAIGAVGLGIIGYFVPRVLGVGYDTISDILNNNLAWKLLLLIAVFKSLALVISLGSGTSGGLLAPMFMASAALGGVFALGIDHIVPGASLAPGAFALVAMGAVFGAASRATFAFIVFAFELTRDYNSVLPLMLVCVIAAAIAMRFLPNSIMTEKLARRGLEIHSEYETNVMKQIKVGEIMAEGVVTVSPEETVRAVAERMASGDPRLMRHRALPIVSQDGRLLGIVTQGDILRGLEENPAGDLPVIEVGSRSLIVAHPDESAFDALTKMLMNNVGRLPVVDRKNPEKMVGYINRAAVMACWGHHLHQESWRDAGWLQRLRRNGMQGVVARSIEGNVLDIGEGHLKVRVENTIEELAVEFPIIGIRPGDHVRVSFHQMSDRCLVQRIEELSHRQ